MDENLTREQISALLDGELDEARTEAVLALLEQVEGRVAWELYHQAGDALRSEEIPLAMSPDFSRKLFARLDAEPIIIAPGAIPAPVHAPAGGSALRRFALPGMVAAAAVATVAFITTPQLMVADSDSGAPQAVVATSTQPATGEGCAKVIAGGRGAGRDASVATEEIMLRDPGIDDYLFAHQRFSPSVYSTAQFARSATFASDSGK